jgi:hypothetical protein
MMAEFRLLFIAESANLVAVEFDGPGIRGVQCAEQMQQRALTRPRRPDYRHKLPTPEPQADLVERAYGLTADPVFAHHVAQFDGQLLVGRIAGIGLSDNGPPARTQWSALQR